MANGIIQINSSLPIGRPIGDGRDGRIKRFWATAKYQDDGSWSIHMYADNVPSLDVFDIKDPITMMSDMHKEWIEQIKILNSDSQI